jgi:hypothetical protein
VSGPCEVKGGASVGGIIGDTHIEDWMRDQNAETDEERAGECVAAAPSVRASGVRGFQMRDVS